MPLIRSPCSGHPVARLHFGVRHAVSANPCVFHKEELFGYIWKHDREKHEIFDGTHRKNMFGPFSQKPKSWYGITAGGSENPIFPAVLGILHSRKSGRLGLPQTRKNVNYPKPHIREVDFRLVAQGQRKIFRAPTVISVPQP